MKYSLLLFVVYGFCFYSGGLLQAQQSTDSITASATALDSLHKNPMDKNQEDSILRLILAKDSVTFDKLTIKKSHFQASLSYLSNNVYLGRKDSSVISYYNPGFGYFNKAGWYAEISAGCLINPLETRVDLITIDAGYQFSSGQYDGEISVSKYFYSSLSTNVKSEMKGSVAYNSSYDFGFIKPSANLALYFDSEVDYALSVGLEHSFYALGDKLEIDPKIVGNGSTQNFYNDYFRKRRYTIKRKGKAPQTGVAKITGIVQNSSQFKIFDYEAGLTVSYTLKKWTFNFLPVYAIPVNPTVIEVTRTLQNGSYTRKKLTENLSNTFYWTLGLQYTL